MNDSRPLSIFLGKRDDKSVVAEFLPPLVPPASEGFACGTDLTPVPRYPSSGNSYLIQVLTAFDIYHSVGFRKGNKLF